MTAPTPPPAPPPARPATPAPPGARAVRLRARLNGARLYLCTDARRHLDPPGRSFTALRELAERALAGGVDIIQLRDKSPAGTTPPPPLEAGAELEALAVLREVCDRHGALLAVNDRADIAHAAGADVLHLGQGDLPPAAARAILGPDVVVGRSCHAEAEVDAAIADGAVDYYCTGPVWPTPTKPGRAAPGLPLVRYAAGRAHSGSAAKPWFAIGGIDARTLAPVLDAGATRVVVVRALTTADDPRAAARELRTRVG